MIFTYFENLLVFVDFFIDQWIFKHDFFNNAAKIDFKNNVIACMYTYKTQYANLVGFFAYNDIDVASLITNLVVNIIKNIVNDFMIV